jgi:hypothetical protein
MTALVDRLRKASTNTDKLAHAFWGALLLTGEIFERPVSRQELNLESTETASLPVTVEVPGGVRPNQVAPKAPLWGQ